MGNSRLIACGALLVAVCAGAPGAVAADGAGNPYTFYGSIAECASAQRARCEACVADHSCAAITDASDGNAECMTLGDSNGRGYFLICIDLALAIDAVASCTQAGAPSCPRDTHASESLASLGRNADFLDDAACGGALDHCLAELYGAPKGDFPGPGSGSGTAPPRHTSIDCGDACSDADTNCDADPDCELDGPSCDDSESTGGACADSNEQSGCSDSGGGGGGCSGDSEDACGADNSSGCDNGDCGGGGGGGGDCGGGGGGGDCGGGGGGDCSGGGGDCGGGGGDCNIAGKPGRGARGRVSPTVLWAFLPLPFAVLARRRALRRRAAAEPVADDAPGEVAP